jgi:dTDP-4-dehydrorhamnose 3,5-epimerase
MKIVKIIFGAVKCVELPRFDDRRGAFTKYFAESDIREQGMKMQLREVYFSRSNKNVIRGMHFQVPPAHHAKCVCVSSGSVRDVVLDLRKNSSTYGQAADIMLSSENHLALFIPPGFAHGFLSLEDNTVMHYLVSSEYSPEHDAGIRWDSFAYDWKVKNPILSDRDKAMQPFASFESPFL